jgi:hypothetical protein
MKTYPYLYAYETGRDDGFRYAVGIIRNAGARADGAYGLFQTADDATLFGEAIARRDGGEFLALPSVEKGLSA